MIQSGRGSAQVLETRSVSLVEVLDRVLDKGLVVAGDIRVSLANVELLTIQIRLLLCSIDKAEQIGLTWWREDAQLKANGLAERLDRIESRLASIDGARTAPRRPSRARAKKARE